MPNMKKSKVDKTPKRKVPEGFEFPRNKRTVPNPPGAPRAQAPSRKKPLPRIVGAKPGERRLLPRDPNAAPGEKRLLPRDPNAKPSPRQLLVNTTTKAPGRMLPKPKTTKKPQKMTPQDAAMKKILEKRYGKIYG